MKLPVIQRFQKQNYPGSPDWFTRFVGDLNLFTETIWNALNANLTVADNLDAQIYTFTLTAGAAAINNTVTFNSTLKHVPQVLVVGRVTNTTTYSTDAPAVGTPVWSFLGTQISVTAIPGLTNGQTYSITFLVL